MKILAVDTSSPALSIAIVADGKTLARFHRKVGTRHSELLAPTLEKLLKKIPPAPFRLKDLDCFAVSIGPGSFTGLRIGVATIKGLAAATGKPVVAVPTLEVLARGTNLVGLRLQTYEVCPIVDARRGNVYTILNRRQTIVSVDELRKRYLVPFLKKSKKGTRYLFFTGDGVASYREKLVKAFGGRVEFAGEKFWYPNAEVVAGLGAKLFAKGKTVDLRKLKPIYLYPKDVQCRKK